MRKPITHNLKIWSQFYDDVASGRKQFEYRTADRDYQVGDTLRLEEFRPALGTYTGRLVEAEVVYVMRVDRNEEKIGLPHNKVIMGIKLKPPRDWRGWWQNEKRRWWR